MVSQAEETQAKEFLKRAEIRTMRKDLLQLREVDSLKERDKIARIKTLEEQLEEKKKLDALLESAVIEKQKTGRNEVLQRNESQEKIAEKDLKNYASEEERQQIFLMESQRLGFEKQVDEIDKVKDPALKLEKNKLLLQKRDWQDKLNKILEQETKLEEEQKFIAGQAQATTISTEKKSLESRRWDLDKEIQDIEKKRWEAEKQIETLNGKVGVIDKQSDENVAEKNILRDKILGVDKSLREIYSVVMAREEEKRNQQSKEQLAQKETLEKTRYAEKEKVQRQQWSRADSLQIPVPVRKAQTNPFAEEEEQRKKFLQDVNQASQTAGQQQKSNIK